MKALLQHTPHQGTSAFILNGPMGICGHQAWQQVSLCASSKAMEPARCHFFFKETAVTRPNSLSKFVPKWKIVADLTPRRKGALSHSTV